MRNIIKVCLFAAILCNAMPAMAQSSDDASARQLKMLLKLKGFWEAKTAIMKLGDKEVTFPYFVDFKSTADNNGLTMNEWCTIPGVGKLMGANLAGVNPYDQKVHWFSVDNMGTSHEHVGEFSDSKHFSMVHKGLQDGKEYLETISLEFIGENKINVQILALLDGKESEKITAAFLRRPDTASR